VAVLRIESIAAGGDGVGRLDGLAVFVPRTVPGELVEASIQPRGRMARGRLLEVIEPSPDRLEPRCSHYEGDRCGGCQLQHIDVVRQRSEKQRIVRDAFARIARRNVALPEIVPGPSAWEYRSRLSLAMRWQGGAWTMGLHSADDVGRIFDLEECPITAPDVVHAWLAVKSASRFLPRVRELRGTVRKAGGDIVFVLEGGDAWPSVREFADATGFHVIRWKQASGAWHVVHDRRQDAALPAGSFDQVNPAVAELARRELVVRALAVHPQTAVDAYAGLGATSAQLAAEGVSVTAIEVDAGAAHYMSSHLPPSSRVLRGRVEDHIIRALPADVVILNPPRAGVDPRVSDALQQGPRPRLVLYMSCDPATLARDVSRLGAYRVTSLRAYDMFPQTAHVEVVCELTPEAS
jgi:23S rRNA (uracil1939-C5)-methyltransferase